jgi:hypothetical protein
MTTVPPFRIAEKQAAAAKAKQALMIGSTELRVFTYREPYQLGDTAQRNSLLRTLNDEFDTTIPLPPADKPGVFYLVVLDGTPVLVPENDALAFTLGVVLAKEGVEVARRVSYRAEMLPVRKG